MDFSLTKEQKMLQQMAREFAEKYIEPAAEKIDLENRVPEEIFKGMADLNLFGIPYPEVYGGAGAGYDGYALIMEQIARASAGVAMTLTGHCLGLSAISVFGTEEQKQKFMVPACQGKDIVSFAFTEPGTGSDPKQLATTAARDGDNYILNGTKRFITNANFPGPIVIFAKDIEYSKLSAFVVDKWCEGYSISEPWNKLGLHGGMLLDVYLNNVRVPAENLLGTPGMGFPVLQTGIAYGKVGVTSIALGGTLACYEEGLKYSKEKMHRDSPISKFQAIQLKIADMAIKYEAARLMTYRMAWLANSMTDPRQYAKFAAMCKTFVCEAHYEVCRMAMDIHGSYGLMNDYKISRLYRDAVVGPQIEGVADVQKMIIAGVILAEK